MLTASRSIRAKITSNGMWNIKAQSVAKGLPQKEHIGYHESSPFPNGLVRIITALLDDLNLELHPM